jgi:hypothetical protein
MISRIYSRHWNISSGCHFQKWPPQYSTNSTLSDFNDISYVGRLWCPEFIPDIEKILAVAIFKMAAKIKHCLISSKFYMWVDNDVPNWFPTLKNVYRLPFSKWPPQYCTNSTLSDFNDISYVGRLWCPELIPQWHRKISTGRHFQNGSHNTPQIQHCSISKVTFDLFFKPVVSGRFGRLHNR